MTFRADVSNGDGTEMHRDLPLPQGEVEREAAEYAICYSSFRDGAVWDFKREDR
jgi:hypothetical protein